jgi:hypothetical protein
MCLLLWLAVHQPSQRFTFGPPPPPRRPPRRLPRLQPGLPAPCAAQPGHAAAAQGACHEPQAEVPAGQRHQPHRERAAAVHRCTMAPGLYMVDAGEMPCAHLMLVVRQCRPLMPPGDSKCHATPSCALCSKTILIGLLAWWRTVLFYRKVKRHDKPAVSCIMRCCRTLRVPRCMLQMLCSSWLTRALQMHKRSEWRTAGHGQLPDLERNCSWSQVSSSNVQSYGAAMQLPDADACM